MMKIKNVAFYAGQANKSKWKEAEQNKSVFMGNREPQDAIVLKKQQAKQKALKIVGDTFATDRKLDEEQNARRERVKELTQQLHELEGYLKAQKEVPEEEMTSEMKEAQAKALKEYEKQCNAVKNEIKAELITIEATKAERLKNSPMQEAQEVADKILEVANKEVLAMLMQEAKDSLEEKLEEKAEQAEKIAEKKEEEEELLAEKEEKQQQAEQQAEKLRNAASGEAQKEIEEMLNKLKLLEEDLKGAAVDEIL